jgi:hypothetical protein
MKPTKIKLFFIFTFVLLGGVHLTGAPSGSSEGDRVATFEIPVFNGGYNIKEILNPAHGTKTITYNVRMKYPAAELIEFYDSYLNGKGWMSSFETCQRHWADSAGDNEIRILPARQMFVSWQNPDLNLQLNLWLKHDLAKMQQDEVAVEGRLQTITAQ